MPPEQTKSGVRCSIVKDRCPHPDEAFVLLGRFSVRLGQLALLFLTPEHRPHEFKRAQVCIEQRQHAVLVPTSQSFAVKLTQLVLIDHLEALVDVGLARFGVAFNVNLEDFEKDPVGTLKDLFDHLYPMLRNGQKMRHNKRLLDAAMYDILTRETAANG